MIKKLYLAVEKISLKDVDRGLSKIKIQVKCDYCGEYYYPVYENWKKGRELSIKKDCCKNCSRKKVKESNLVNYGIESTSSLDSVKEKTKKTCLKKYGVEQIFYSSDFCEKRKNTNLEKYGSPSPLGNKEIIKKSKETLMKNYGVTNPTLNKSILEKSIKTLTTNNLQKVSK